jgi:hypothetical protein
MTDFPWEAYHNRGPLPHFPTRYFKYLILASFGHRHQNSGVPAGHDRPSGAGLLKQYREGYERFFCPICDYPIRRGPLKYVFWSRRSIKKLQFPPQPQSSEEPYICPACHVRIGFIVLAPSFPPARQTGRPCRTEVASSDLRPNW